MNTLQNGLEALTNQYSKMMPNGYVSSRITSFGFGHFTIGMIDNVENCPNRIRQNDRAFGNFILSLDNNGNYVLERNFHNLTVKPKHPHLALSYEKVSYRKITAKNAEELVVKFVKYMDKFNTMAKEQLAAGNMYKVEEIKPQYLEVWR